jgi:uncharacterized protein YbcV (DUF1398 family)
MLLALMVLLRVLQLIVHQLKQRKNVYNRTNQSGSQQSEIRCRLSCIIQDIKKIGVTFYETFVTDGHTDYYGTDAYKTSSMSRYNTLKIAEVSNAEQFKADLKVHQQGKTDYSTFFNDCAKSGIQKWTVCIDKMTCTYYDQAANEILVELIPQ